MGLVLALNDVTDVHNLARSIEYQATHDPLTSADARSLIVAAERALAVRSNTVETASSRPVTRFTRSLPGGRASGRPCGRR